MTAEVSGPRVTARRVVSGAALIVALAASASLVLAAAAACGGTPGAGDAASPAAATGDAALARAFDEHAFSVEVEGSGEVVRLLADDEEGSRHQRFVLRLDSGQTLLVAHNIDVAARVDGLQVGDRVAFRGEYEWSEQGGTVHWTHHDPSGEHRDGWLRHDGQTVQ